jgi:hypothetical protein
MAEPTDRRDQLLDAGEVATTQRLPLDDREEDLDQVQPGRKRRGEVCRWTRGWLASQACTLACLWVA